MIKSSNTWQKKYRLWLLINCQRLEARLIIWFVPVDYDLLWERMADDALETFKVWRDSGLYDEKLKLRPAGKVWRKWLKRPLENH